MKYIYSEKDLDLISWERIDEFINKIYLEVNEFLNKHNLKIRYITPILRGGGVPAMKLSHMFNVIDILPVQLKYNLESQEVLEKISLDYFDVENLKEDECILLVEGNHLTGKTANIAANMIRKKFGSKTKIIYVSLTRDYSFKDSVKDVLFTTWGMTTNEAKLLSKEECEKLNIDYYLVSVYPWENVKEELEELNAEEINV